MISYEEHNAVQDIAYELYKAQWMQRFTSRGQQTDPIRRWAKDMLSDIENHGNEAYPFREWLQAHDSDRTFYTSKEDFLESEYRDISHMRDLLQDDDLIALYEQDLEEEYELEE